MSSTVSTAVATSVASSTDGAGACSASIADLGYSPAFFGAGAGCWRVGAGGGVGAGDGDGAVCWCVGAVLVDTIVFFPSPAVITKWPTSRSTFQYGSNISSLLFTSIEDLLSRAAHIPSLLYPASYWRVHF